MRRQISFAAAGFALTFIVVTAYWMACEWSRPGRQYADPLWPCLFIAGLGAMVGNAAFCVTEIAATFAARRKRGKR